MAPLTPPAPTALEPRDDRSKKVIERLPGRPQISNTAKLSATSYNTRWDVIMWLAAMK